MIRKIKDGKKAEGLFAGWEETLIWSCLEGVMGDIYVDNLERPRRAAAKLGDFCFFSGEASKELIFHIWELYGQEFMIMVPRDGLWAGSIEECFGTGAKRVIRYATKKEGNVFERERLQKYMGKVSDEYDICEIDERLYHMCLAEGWSRDLVAQYGDYETYKRLGLGVAILREGMLVSGASSYSRYKEGIEIEIDTREDYRRRGLAAASGAGLILSCLERGLYPSWDAQNTASLALAQKLGYHFSHEYLAYEVCPD